MQFCELARPPYKCHRGLPKRPLLLPHAFPFSTHEEGVAALDSLSPGAQMGSALR